MSTDDNFDGLLDRSSLLVFALVWILNSVVFGSVLIGLAIVAGVYALAMLGLWYFKKRVYES